MKIPAMRGLPSPEKKLFVSDGRTMFLYFPADRQVMKNPVPDQDQATSAVLFLMGKGDIVRDFSIRWGDGGGDTVYRLRLEPKTRQAEYDWLEVTADRRTLQIVGLTAADAQGGRSSFAFSNFKENGGLADKMFEFTIPRGTEVMQWQDPLTHGPALIVVLAAGLFCAACASGSAMRLAEKSERRSDFDRAVVEYTNVLRRNPTSRGPDVAERVQDSRRRDTTSAGAGCRRRALSGSRGRAAARHRAHPPTRTRSRSCGSPQPASNQVRLRAATRPSCRR